MTERTTDPPSESNTLKIGFGTSRHRVKMSTFMAGMRSSQLIIPSVIELMFHSHVRANLYIGTPRPGSVWLDVYVNIVGIGGSAVALHKALELEFTKRFYKSLFGSELDIGHWADKAGLLLRDMCLSAYRKPVSSLKDALPDSESKQKILEGKAELFAACTADSEVERVEFVGSDERLPETIKAVTRNDFLKHTPPSRVAEYYQRRYILDAYIVSPVILERHDEPWRLEVMTDSRSFQAKMRDREFKNGVLRHDYRLRENGWADTVTVLVEECVNKLTGRSSPSHRFIRTVYRFNGKKLKPLPSRDELQDVETLTDQQQLMQFDDPSPDESKRSDE